jgi:hypothetical protein
MSARTIRVIAAGLGLVLLIGLGVLVFGPARGAREDIGAQRRLVAGQLATVRAQLDTMQRQFALQQRQLAIARQQLAVSRHVSGRVDQLYTLARRTAKDADTQLSLSRTLLDLARSIQGIARDTLRHAASLDHKTGPTLGR